MIKKITPLLPLLILTAGYSFGQSPVSRTEEVILQAEDRVSDSDLSDVGSDEGQVLNLIDFDDDGSAAGDSSMLQSDETISIDFPDEEIRVVLRNVADLYELNLVIPEALVGRTSVKLKNVTWAKVFKVILEPVQYTYIEDENIIMIVSREDLAAEPTETRVFLINFARAGDISGTVDPMVSPEVGGRVQVDVRSNALVITERPSKMDNIQRIIDRLDKPTDQVMIESKFIEATNQDIKNIGVNWASLNGYNVSAGPFESAKIRDDNITRSILDNDATEFTNGTSVTNEGSNFSNTTRDASDLFNDISNIASTDRLASSVFNAASFNVVLSALESNDDVKLVSNPTVVTMNNSTATINIGEDYPIPKFTYNEERGTFEISDIEYKSIGINLEVTPQVNSAGFIKLDIKPEVSSRAGEVTLGGAAGTEVPIISSRKTQTNVIIKDGYTLAIGGLVESTDIDGGTSVPILGKIPLLGRLFSSESDDYKSRNLIIFITAKTLNPDGSTYEDIIDPRMLHEMNIRPEDIPGYEIDSKEKELIEAIAQYRNQIKDLKQQMELAQKLEELKAAEQAMTAGAE